MHRKASAVNIVRFLAKKIEKLGVHHGNQEVKSRVVVAHDEKQSRSFVAQGIKVQLVVCGYLAKFRNVEGSKAGATADEDGFSCLS